MPPSPSPPPSPSCLLSVLAGFQGSVLILVRWRRTSSSPHLLNISRLAYQSVGVIYGDIGTSPLYVYSSTFLSEPSYDDLLGALSLIIWTVTLMVSIKYVLIVLRADDEGEGGTFAIYSLLARYVRFFLRLVCGNWPSYIVLGQHRPSRSKRRKIDKDGTGRALEPSYDKQAYAVFYRRKCDRKDGLEGRWSLWRIARHVRQVLFACTTFRVLVAQGIVENVPNVNTVR